MEIGQVLNQVDKLAEGPVDATNLAYIRRMQRDAVILRKLEQINNSKSINPSEYLEKTLKEAKEVVEKNSEDLKKLKELRSSGTATQEQIEELFNNNKSLLEARAYLILGCALSDTQPDSEDSKFFNSLMDSDGSSIAIRNQISTNIKDILADSEGEGTLTRLHDACSGAMIDQINSVIEYLKSVDANHNEANTTNQTDPAVPDQDAPKSEDSPAASSKLPVTLDNILGVGARGYRGGWTSSVSTFFSGAPRSASGLQWVSEFSPTYNPKAGSCSSEEGGTMIEIPSASSLLLKTLSKPTIGEKTIDISSRGIADIGATSIYMLGAVRTRNEDISNEANRKQLEVKLKNELREFIKSKDAFLVVKIVKQGFFGIGSETGYISREDVIELFGENF